MEAAVTFHYITATLPKYAADLQTWINKNNEYDGFTFDEAYIP